MGVTLPVSRRHEYDELALYVQVDAKLVDAFSASYEIVNGLTGDTIVEETTVTTAGRYAPGCYGVHDPAANAPWTPTEVIPDATVVWRFALVSGGPTLVVERRFAVVPESVTLRPRFHLGLINDLVGSGSSMSQKAALETLELWTDRVERYCGRSFRPIRGGRRLKWRSGRRWSFAEDVFALGSVKARGDWTALDSSIYEVFGSATGALANPRVEFGGGFLAVDSMFYDVDGVWGTVDPWTLGAPPAIEYTVKAFLIDLVSSPTPPEFSVGPIRREKTDGHEVEYATVTSQVKTGMLALLKSPELRDQLDLYRAPYAVTLTGRV